MAAALPALPSRYSVLLANAGLWDDPHPDYTLLTAVVGGAAATDQNATAHAFINTGVRSPVAMAFIIDGEADRVYIGHTPTVFPADISNPSGYDGLVTVLVGDDDAAVIPVVLPTAAFGRRTDVRCLRIDAIVGPGGFGAAAAPVIHQGPHPAGTADTDQLRARNVALLPSGVAAEAVEHASNGSYTLPAFYARFLAPAVAAGGANLVLMTPLLEWFRVACTMTTVAGADAFSLGLTPEHMPGLAAHGGLHRWVNRTRALSMARLGVGGPGLTNAAFNAGVTAMTDTLEASKNDTLAYYRSEKEKTFSDKHGDALGQRIFRLTHSNVDADLPEVHRLLVKSPKSREYAVVGALLAERAEASHLPISTANAPIATTRLVDDLFRTYMPGGTGLEFGKGLSPFAIVCEGHREAADLQKLVKGASLVEGGTSVSLEDTNKLISSDIRFPTEVYIAVEKLYGWSIVADVYHGVNHPVATSIRRAVHDIGPTLFRLVTHMGDNLTAGMDLVCRVMFELQQDYFGYLRESVSSAYPAGLAVPDFKRVCESVWSYRADALSPLPLHWYSLTSAPYNERYRPRARPAASPRDAVSSAPTVNAHADQRLLERFRASPFSSLTSMLEGHDVEVPKHNGDPVCLTWALKGQCSGTCKRKAQHVRYSRGLHQKLHGLLDECGVVNPQP